MTIDLTVIYREDLVVNGRQAETRDYSVKRLIQYNVGRTWS